MHIYNYLYIHMYTYLPQKTVVCDWTINQSTANYFTKKLELKLNCF